MAFGRRPYTTKFRPWVDSDDEVDLIWYNAEPAAPALGYPSKIQQLDNVSSPWLAQGVGEVFGAPRTFNNRRAIPFLPLNHVCGTQSDFEHGGVLDPIPPPVLYDRNDIPICCGPPFIGQGGGVGSGTATVTVTPARANHYRIDVPGHLTAVIVAWDGDAPPTWSASNPDPEGTNFVQSPGTSGFTTGWGLLHLPIAVGSNATWQAPATWDGTGSQVFTPCAPFMPGWGNATVTWLD